MSYIYLVQIGHPRPNFEATSPDLRYRTRANVVQGAGRAQRDALSPGKSNDAGCRKSWRSTEYRHAAMSTLRNGKSPGAWGDLGHQIRPHQPAGHTASSRRSKIRHPARRAERLFLPGPADSSIQRCRMTEMIGRSFAP